jgi:hypothetical protein
VGNAPCRIGTRNLASGADRPQFDPSSAGGSQWTTTDEENQRSFHTDGRIRPGTPGREGVRGQFRDGGAYFGGVGGATPMVWVFVVVSVRVVLDT